MFRDTRVPLAYSGFVLLGGIDLWLRFIRLEREQWTCNTGVFWGIEIPPVLLWLGIVGVLACCLWLLTRLNSAVARWAMTVIFIGGAVNCIDRLVSGCVLDYLSWPFGLSAFFPDFNLADTGILFGFLLLLWWYFRESHNRYVVQESQ